MKTKSSFL